MALEKEHKKKLQFKFAWNQMPAELRPQTAKRKNPSGSKAKPQLKKPNLVEKIDAKMDILEQKEKDEREDDKSDKDTDVINHFSLSH